MAKINPIVQFIALLITSLAVAFFLHIVFLKTNELPQFDNLIVLSYVVNGILAGTIFAGLYAFRNKLKNQIGFLFIGGSFLKFIFFFILFYPVYKADGEMSGMEFASFFIPYGISLVVETVFTARLLKKLD
ncbi:DUF6168 family protein [Maribacter sp. HTCC2170]|uniref:DUF6168 family protein n=1 Tax=Maribacter sp. (strain HTCC2170 / KCCM 42371) TaxID=313603 RepID=UPI00006BD512|nr:DUF6168 family protein [Maribacter sp. HTCC2170]EAR02745.1 hypothetical protein FB2170_05640 [Maribacter sp. HTCC2170]